MSSPAARRWLPRRQDVADLDDVGAAVGELDRDDDVGAGGQRGAGHDPLHGARGEGDDVGAPGRDVVGDRQPDRAPRAAVATSAQRAA